MADEIPQAPLAYDKSNEQRARTAIDERLGMIEAKLNSLQTTFGTLALGEGVVTLVNGANNNVSLGYDTYIRIIGPTGAFSITGITGGERGRVVFLRNTVPYAMTLADESASSSAANRIYTQSGSDFVTTAQGSAVLIYDVTLARWVMIASQS